MGSIYSATMGSPAGVLRGLHVFVVEDDRDAREILTTVLEYVGALVTAAPTAAEALRHLRATTPDVVLADMNLGRHDAGALLARARKAGTTAPFIVVSAADYDLTVWSVWGSPPTCASPWITPGWWTRSWP